MILWLGARIFTLIALLFLATPIMAQVPAGATPITLTQVNTLAGITTWTFTDAAGTYYIQAPAYISLFIPQGPTMITPVAAPAIWTTAPSVPATPTASPDLTAIANNVGTIVDATGGKWTVVNGVVQFNGAAIGYSSGVVKLVVVKGVFWQMNTANNWYYWSVTAKTWNGGAAPI